MVARLTASSPSVVTPSIPVSTSKVTTPHVSTSASKVTPHTSASAPKWTPSTSALPVSKVTPVVQLTVSIDSDVDETWGNLIRQKSPLSSSSSQSAKHVPFVKPQHQLPKPQERQHLQQHRSHADKHEKKRKSSSSSHPESSSSVNKKSKKSADDKRLASSLSPKDGPRPSTSHELKALSRSPTTDVAGVCSERKMEASCPDKANTTADAASRQEKGTAVTENKTKKTWHPPNHDNPAVDQICITDVTSNLLTVTITECRTCHGFFRDRQRSQRGENSGDSSVGSNPGSVINVEENKND